MVGLGVVEAVDASASMVKAPQDVVKTVILHHDHHHYHLD